MKNIIFYLDTFQEGKNYFTGESSNNYEQKYMKMQPGNYRVIDGELHIIIDSLPRNELNKRFDKILEGII